MMNIQREVRKILNWYGEENQINKAIEELEELKEELEKFKDCKGGIDALEAIENIKLEMADVTIMLVQLEEVFNYDKEDFAKKVEYKIDRTLKRIEKEKEVEGLK